MASCPKRALRNQSIHYSAAYTRKADRREIVTLLSLDIERAFDNAWWPTIKLRLTEEKCPVNVRRVVSSYLSDNEVKVRYAGEESRRSTRQNSKGCVQVSIGGPIFCNLLLDPLLKELESAGNYCQAFADDVVMVVNGKTTVEIYANFYRRQ